MTRISRERSERRGEAEGRAKNLITVDAAQAGTRIDKLLVEALPGLGRAGAKRLFSEGKVRVTGADGKRRRAAKGDVVAEGDAIEVDANVEEPGAVADAGAALSVALETPEVLVLDKPAGQPTAPLKPGELGTLVNALVARYPEVAAFGVSPREAGIVHRLDTDTSGLVIAARTPAAFDVLRAALSAGRLDKRYLLVCEADGLAETGTIEIPLAPHPKDRKRVLACVHPRDVARLDPRPASTSFRIVRTAGRWALVEARAPKAARHQIRAHFAAIEHPLAGDALYGGDATAVARHALHAHHVGWSGDKTVPAFVVGSPLPPDLAALVGAE